MAKSTLIFQPKCYALGAKNFANADGTTSVAIVTAGADDAILKSLSITSNDTASRVFEIILKQGATEFIIDTITVPPASGTDGVTPAMDGLTATFLPQDRVDKKILPLKGGTILMARAQAAVTAAKTVAFVAVLEEF